MRNQSYTYYNLHLIISRFGNKLTSMVLVFYFMNLFPDKLLFLTVLLFSISNLPSIILTEFYARIIKNINSFKELIFLDLIAGFLIIGIFFSLNNIFFLFLFYIFSTIIADILQRIDNSLFFSITRNNVKEEYMIRKTNSIESFLSIISPALAGIIIQKIGYPNSLWIDVITFVLGAFLYYLISNKASIICEDNKKVVTEIKEFWKNSNDLKTLSYLYIIVALITNLEEPLVLSYFSIERNFSDNQVGMALSMFGIGMFLGSYLFKYISLKRVNNFLFFMLADSIFSFILSLNLAKPILIFCYTLQGIFAMFMIIFFKAFTQKLFSDTIEFSLFRNSFIRYTSIATVISYFIAIAISMITNNGSIIFRIMSLCEFLVFIYYYYYLKRLNNNK